MNKNDLKDKYLPVLDGFVGLVDFMGEDADIERAARTSYGKDLVEPKETGRLINYLTRHNHCYDEDTEVLTDEGFVLWKYIDDSHKLACWDEEKNSIVYEKPNYLIKEKYCGKMYSVEHGGISLLVTPNHKMYVKTKEWKEKNNKKNMYWEDSYKLTEAEKLGHRSMIKFKTSSGFSKKEQFCPSMIGLDKNLNSAGILKLIGFFVGDGFCQYGNQIHFRLKRKRKIEYLKEICSLLNTDLRIAPNGVTYTINIENIGKIFKDLFYNESKEKCIPNNLCYLDQTDLLFILDGLKNSDGSIKRNTWVYSTTSEQLAENFQVICVNAGLTCSSKFNGYLYKLNVCSMMKDCVINHENKNTSYIDYDGNVYCANTRTGILIVRRNKKVCLSGNSTPSEMVIVKFHIACPIFVMRQLIRHRTLSVNEFSGRYTECPDKFYLPDSFRKQSKTNKQGSEGVIHIDKDEVAEHYSNSYKLYKKLLSQGVSKELARIVLPLSLYTYFYVECDIRNWFHFMGLRSDSHAQYEIQVYSDAIGKFIKQLFPKSFDAFLNYKFNSRTFTYKEIQFLQTWQNTTQYDDNGEPLSLKSMLILKNNMFNIWSTDREIDDFIKNISFQPDDSRFDLVESDLKEASYFKEQNSV